MTKQIITAVFEIEYDNDVDTQPSRSWLLTKLKEAVNGNPQAGTQSRYKRDEDGRIMYDDNGLPVMLDDPSTHRVTRCKVFEHSELQMLDAEALEISHDTRLHKYDIDLVALMNNNVLRHRWHDNTSIITDVDTATGDIKITLSDVVKILNEDRYVWMNDIQRNIVKILGDKVRTFINKEMEDIEFAEGEAFEFLARPID